MPRCSLGRIPAATADTTTNATIGTPAATPTATTAASTATTTAAIAATTAAAMVAVITAVFLSVALGGCADGDGGAGTDTRTADAPTTDAPTTDAPDTATTDAPGADAPDTATPIATWTDPATGLTWPVDPGDVERDWDGALAYCAALDGGSGWRLPDIDELRSLFRGCPDTVTGGACTESVARSGAGPDDYDGEACMGCVDGDGPGVDGCFRPPELHGPCEWTWSSTTADDIATYACFAHFRNAHLSHEVKANALGHHVLCVR